MDDEEKELESESTLLYPTTADSDEEMQLDLEAGNTRYLFPSR